MAHGMDDNFGFGDFIKVEVGVRDRRQAANGRVFGALADERLLGKFFDQEFDTLPYTACALRRTRVEISGNVFQVG
ncbi:hypothetical protein ATY75_09820 [Rhizobium sp. N122]|nr:hypothetical protein ATY75_09820 [Rhizobium sp. N122]